MKEHTRDTTPLPQEPYYEQPAPVARPNGPRRVGIALIVVGLLWLLFALPGRGFTLFGGGSDTVLDQTYAAHNLVMNVGNADVEVKPWSDNGIHVEATQRGSEREEISANIDRSGDTLHLSDSRGGWFNWFGARDVRYTVLVPATAQVQIETTSGDITVQDIAGKSGVVPGMVLHSVSGDVTASGAENGLTINTTNGDIDLERINNGLNVTTVNGDMSLKGVSGALKLQSTNGDISVHDADARQLNISTTNGGIDFSGSLASGSQNHVEAVNGDVTLSLPQDSSFRLQATTVRGDLSLDDSFQAQRSQDTRTALDATVGSGAASLNVQTVGGDIEVNAQ
jgi:hypothetical protein